MKTHMTWVEGVALLVEKKLPLGRIGWLVVYGIALLAILPIMINLGLGTGWAAFAYASEGFYASKPFSAETTLLINLLCTLLGWFFCCWSILLFRCLRRYWNFTEYEAPCPLWISGCVLLAQLALLAVMLVIILTWGGSLSFILPLILIALLACLRRRISQSS